MENKIINEKSKFARNSVQAKRKLNKIRIFKLCNAFNACIL